jgi:cold shock CspA family protein
MTTLIQNKLLGRVQRVVAQQGKAGYGFIVTDDRVKYFFHSSNMTTRKLPEPGTLVHFDVLPQTAGNKRDRAINIEIIAVPA